VKTTDLDQVGLERLLAALGPDREAGAEAYVRLQRKLTTIYAARTVRADEAADEAINRTAAKLKAKSLDNPGGFAYRTSTNVVRELLRGPDSKTTAVEETTLPRHAVVSRDEEPPAPIEDERRLDCQSECLRALTDDDRAFLCEYLAVESDKAKPKHRRKALADSRQKTPAAVRKKAQRLKDKVRACVEICLRMRHQTSDT
jgi:DNA-directed RNA polymerase specialized sigma24 family protein